ncbi:MAG: hypothetical protein BYD32DRAFT_467047 [Podila humilis]|nr:MAG: hypothetical protein BYD32DRAFT_467047 [Podila humilis]
MNLGHHEPGTHADRLPAVRVRAFSYPFSLDMEEYVSRVLEEMQWSTIKSLVLSGDHIIDDWIHLWARNESHMFAHGSTYGSQLLQLRIIGTSAIELPFH